MRCIYIVPFLLLADIVNSLDHKLLIISFDGFRFDYLEGVNTPNFDRFINEGVMADYITATFVTKTFPTHYSIVTGLYQESHGIVGNKMYDPVLNDTFSLRTRDTEWWDNGGEPMWVTVSKQGGRSADYFWPGGDVVTNGGYQPDIWLPYNESHPYRDRIDTVVKWFTEENIDFVTLYFNEPDGSGHNYGHDSPEVDEVIRQVDDLLGYLIDELIRVDMYDVIDIIITADHGMADISPDKKVFIYDYVDPSHIDIITDTGPYTNILPKENKITEVYNALKGQHPNISVYLREEIPEYWHYGNNRRVMPIFVACDEEWEILENRSTTSEERLNLPGNHGFDNRFMSMKPAFFARGPGFKDDYQATPFDSVDIYPMMCHLMELKAAPNNGSLDNILHMLRKDDTSAALRVSYTRSLFIVIVNSFYFIVQF
ncbi:ectonucleotide pyrophosphatase/phosphodiesterase family member 5-like [Glandiceps talaboti]